MSVSTRFERPTLDDLEDILALMNDPLSVHRQKGGSHAAHPETYAQLYERLTGDENLLMLASDRLAGYASWQTYGAHAHLNVMSIAGAFQRQGLGEVLFSAFLQTVKDEGGMSISLRAYRDSDWALRFYTRLGMRPYRPGDEAFIGEGGLAWYIRTAIENDQWPAEDKVMFVGEIE